MTISTSNKASINPLFNNENYWSDAWIRHIEDYLDAPYRCGYWLESQFSSQLSILEIAGGSCRDSRYLAMRGYNSIGSDFDQKTLDYLENRFPDSPLKVRREDAFKFSFGDNSLDLTFSNGFWVLFANDEQLYTLMREQARVTKKYVVSLVHNAENERLVKTFQEKSKTDSLYNIRFFQKDELPKIVKDSGIKYKSIALKKFGGSIDILLSKKIKDFSNPIYNFSRWLVPRLYDYQPWSNVERIALIVELE